MSIDNEKIKNLKLIKARNRYEKVYLSKFINNDKLLIVKTFAKESESAKMSFLRDKLVDFEHENINKLVTWGETDDKFYIAREYLNGKDLQNLNLPIFWNVKKRTNFYIKVLLEIVKGIHFLHSKELIHRDIRPSNIFICSDKNGEINYENPDIKLLDYGTIKAKSLQNIDNFSPYALIFSPPEQVLRFHDLINETSDIYALGVTLWTLLVGKLPFNHQIPEVVANLQLTYQLTENKRITKNIFDVISKATFKVPMKKSYNKYSRAELREIILKGQSQRYQSVNKFADDLTKCISF